MESQKVELRNIRGLAKCTGCGEEREGPATARLDTTTMIYCPTCHKNQGESHTIHRIIGQIADMVIIGPTPEPRPIFQMTGPGIEDNLKEVVEDDSETDDTESAEE